MYLRRAGLQAIPRFKMMAMRVEFLRPEKHGMAERQALHFANALAFRLYLTCKTLTEIFKLYLEDSLYP